MPLFKLTNKNSVQKISPIKARKEKDIQNLFEANLEEILNVVFLASEYSTGFGGRIDSLGIDKNGSPVIIEYKRNQNDNVINQGLSYLRWLLDHKANFEMLCRGKKIDIKIDWDSPRVICIAENYNKFDLDTVEILPLKIELLEYSLYENDILQIGAEKQRKIKISTAKIFNNAKKEKTKEVLQKDYNIEYHLKNAEKEIKNLYSALREKITSIDDSIIEEPKKMYIAFKMATNIVDVVIYKDKLKIFLNLPSGKLKDSHKIARDLKKPQKIGHWGNGDYEIKITSQSPLEPILELIRQAYEYNK